MNKIITGPPFYEANRFAKVRLRSETRTLLSQKPQGREAAHLNRLLLADAYVNDLWPPGVIIFDANSGFSAAINYSAKLVTMYDREGKMRWAIDMGAALAEVDKELGIKRQTGFSGVDSTIGSVRFLKNELIVTVISSGINSFSIDLQTGNVMYQGAE
jgi:hypothetical protein